MAVITYERGYPNTTYFGTDWEAYRWVNKKDTLILDQLWRFINNNRMIPYEQLCELLKTFYKTKTVKSYAELHKDGKRFEITNRGIMPKILIVNKKDKCQKKQP